MNKKCISIVFLLLSYIAIAEEQKNPIQSDCSCSKQESNGKIKQIPLHGKVKIVTAFADFKVQVVTAFEDIAVKKVTAFPDNCGEWQYVDSFEDYSVQFVDAFPDFTIKYVDAFPGVK